ncbi:hypothetical protein HF086_000773, partial [Spodoptera exigua]
MCAAPTVKLAADHRSSEQNKTTEQESSSQQPLDTVEEVNENVPSEIFERPFEQEDFVEIPAKIFGLKEVSEPLTIPGLNNAIYELGVVNMCWPEIDEPVFENRTCFPPSYYTNSPKERLLLAYAENFRRQYNFHYKMRKPILLQVPNECGLQKMVCTSIRPTKLNFDETNSWQGIASLVSDYFDYEPLTKPTLHVSTFHFNNITKMLHFVISKNIFYTQILLRVEYEFSALSFLIRWIDGVTCIRLRSRIFKL